MKWHLIAIGGCLGLAVVLAWRTVARVRGHGPETVISESIEQQSAPHRAAYYAIDHVPMLGEALRDVGGSVRSVPGGVVVVGSERVHGMIADVLSVADVARAQYAITVTLIEIGITRDEQIGVAWLVALASSVVEDGLRVSVEDGGVIRLTGGDMSAIIEAVASSGRARVESQPSLTVMMGQPGRLSFGEQRPLVVGSVLSESAVRNVSYDYRTIGVTLMVDVLPGSDESSALLQIKQSADDVAGSVMVGGDSVPVINSRTLETVVRCGVGETVVLGGLKRRVAERSRVGVPGLMSVPWLGRAFRSDREIERETEMVVMLHLRSVGSSERKSTPIGKTELAPLPIKMEGMNHANMPKEDEKSDSPARN